jgi:hypothetical protein
MALCFCTIAIHAPYRRGARLLCGDLPEFPWVVLTDEPDDFADLPVRAVKHVPTGPMWIDPERLKLKPAEVIRRPAYHDKRFALMAALEDFDTAIFLDADTRFSARPRVGAFPPGLALLPESRGTLLDHLKKKFGAWRLPHFVELARWLTGSDEILSSAIWCHESCYAVTRQDGRETRFFDAWGRSASFMEGRDVLTGEGGVMGLAAAYAGLTVDHAALTDVALAIIQGRGAPTIERPDRLSAV